MIFNNSESIINTAKNIGVCNSKIFEPKREPEENTKLAILIVENGIKNENGED
ncbi:hypothetical protein [uncultured Treponema sp.]|uniref:hypothetical protein n=1 Tax=uncultured Treponema sp. TaxID=162155 RepID=UPI002597383B|nr:hypothetical protein [uncultured Treponema sp.]